MPAESVIERLREMVESPCTLQYLMANKADVALLLAVAEAGIAHEAEHLLESGFGSLHCELCSTVRALRAGGERG